MFRKFKLFLAVLSIVAMPVGIALSSDIRTSGGGGAGPGGDGCNPPEGTVGSMLTNANGGNCGTTATVVVSGSVATVTGKLSVDNVDVDGNTLSTTDTNGNLTLSPAGDGDVVVASDTLNFSDNSATISGTNLTISPTGTFEATGTTATLDSSGGISLEAQGGTITFKGAGDAALGTITADGWTGKTAAVNIGGVEFDSSSSINLPGVNEAGTQNIITGATSLMLKAQGSGHSATVHSVNASVAVTAGTTLDMSSAGVAELASTGGSGATAGVVLDSNADIKLESNTGVINFTKASLADMGTITLDESGDSPVGVYSGKSATTGKLHSSVNIGGVPFDGATSINLPGVNQAGTVDTAGTAAIATKVTVTASPTTNGEFYVPVYSTATGDLDTTTDTELRFNPNTHVFDAKKMKTESITTDDFLLVDSGGNTTVEISNKKITLSNGAADAGTTTLTVSANGQLALGTSDSDGSEADISVTADGSMSFTSASSENITLSPGSNKVLLGNFLEVAGSGTSAKDLDFKLGQANGQFTFSNSAGTALLTIDDTSPDIITAHTLFKAASKFYANNVWNTEANPVLAIQIAADGTVTFPVGLTIPNDAVGNAQLANNAVNTAELVDNAVTDAKIAAGAVDTSELADDAVTDAKIAAGAVGTSELANDAVTDAKIAAGAVGTSELADDAVTAAKIAASAVETAALNNDAVTGPKIADQAITNANINNSAAIAYSKMEGAVACGGIDDTTALTNAITAVTNENTDSHILFLTGASCKFGNVEIKDNLHITCASNTVLRAINATNPMFKRGASFIQNWSVTDCTVSMEGYHTEFLDVAWNDTTGPSDDTEGNTGWLVDNVKVSFSESTTSETQNVAFAYFNLSCDPKRGSTSTIGGQSCAFTNNRILGSINSATSNINANDTGVNFAGARERKASLVGPDSLLISQNNITLVEGAAASFAFRSDLSTDSGGYVYATISDNVFSTHSSETPIIDTSDPAAGAPVGVSYSQITGNTFAVNSATSEGWFAKLDGGNNQIVGNTFKPGTAPVIGNGVNFVGNYTATTDERPITACKNYPVNSICAHVSFVGNVATGRFEVYNPDDLVISSNKFLGTNVGVDIIRQFTGTANINRLRSISIMGNTFSISRQIASCNTGFGFCAPAKARCLADGGTWEALAGGGSGTNDSGSCSGASNSLAAVAFKVSSGGSWINDAGIISDVQITGNVMGKGEDPVQDKPNFCVDGGSEATKIVYKGFQVLDNILGCKYPGWDGAAAGTTGQTFDGTLETYAFCGNADRTTTGLVQSCASDKEQRVPVSFDIPSGGLAYGTAIPCWKVGTCASGSVANCNSSSDCASSAACNGAPSKACNVQLTGFAKTSLHDSVYFSPRGVPEVSGLAGARIFSYDAPVNVAGNLSGMRCRTDRPQVNVGACGVDGYEDWGKKFQLRKASSLGGAFSDVTNMFCEVKGCDASGTTATQCSATGNVDIVATDVVQIYVTEVGSNVGAVQVSTLGSGVTCEFDWKQS